MYIRSADERVRVAEDRQLVKIISSGEGDERNDAVRKLRERYERLIYQKAHRCAGGEVVGQDDIYAILLQTIETWVPEKGMFSTWVGQNTFYYYSHRFQSDRAERKYVVASIADNTAEMYESDGEDSNVIVPEDDTPFHLPHAALEIKALSMQAQDILDQLPPRQRETILLFVGGGQVNPDDLAVANATVYSIARLTEAGIL